MGIHEMAAWLKSTPLSAQISQSDWIFPTLESIHILAIVIVVGSIAIVDLRLMGLRARNRDVNELLDQLTPISLSAFVVAFAAGALLFTAKPDIYIANLFFVTKMGLLLLAGLNMAVFHLFFYKGLADIGLQVRLPLRARLSGLLSLSFWFAIIVCGRWIGFTT